MRTVFGLDLSTVGIEAAHWTAEHLLPDTPIDLVYCVDVPAMPGFLKVHDMGHDEILAQAETNALEALEAVAKSIDEHRVDVYVERGSAPDGLQSVATRLDADLIAVGPHGGHGRPGFFGSTASRLIRRALFPVLVARSVPAGPVRRILVAIDESEPALAAAAMAARLGLAHGATVQGLFAYDTLIEGLPGGASLDLSEDMETAASDWILGVLSGAGVPDHLAEAATDRGHPGSALCEAGADCDLIVMGSHGSAMGGEALGSVARYVVGHAPCPVLVVPGP